MDWLSVNQQEVRALIQRNHPHANNPRKAFDVDLSNFSIQQQNLGREVVICMDANTLLDSAEMQTFMSNRNLHSIAEQSLELSKRKHQNNHTHRT